MLIKGPKEIMVPQDKPHSESLTKNKNDDAHIPLAIRLFGPFDVRVHGRPLGHLRTRKGQWLLALLVLRAGREVERTWLAGNLWLDSPEKQALASLRRSLTDLRQALGPEAGRLTSPTPHTLRLDLSGAYVDVLNFDTAVRHGDLPSLQAAVSEYVGPLLEGCGEEWVLPEREEREQAYVVALELLAAGAAAQKEFPAAVGYLRRAVAIDPLRESAHRALMRCLSAGGNLATAILVYRDLRLHLRREMNAEPDAETTALFNQIRQEARGRAAKVPVPQLPLPSATKAIENRLGLLPRPLTDLIGREEEISAVALHLAKSRLVTLTGTGGVGKTHLAIRVAEDAIDAFSDGVWFVDLAPVTDPLLVPQTVAAVLGIREQSGQETVDSLRAYLRSRSLLLVLDNCEHLLDACVEITDSLLTNCPRLHILATSRQPLRLTGEVVWRVPSLTLPPALQPTLLPQRDQPLAALSQYAAVRLFMERARAAFPPFEMTEQNRGAIVQICQRLDGIPLALELAAARVAVLAPQQIAERLDDRFRLLTSGSSAALARQQTLRATLDWSYDLLTESEKILLRRLSVFAGSLTLEAAEVVCALEDGEVGVLKGSEILDLLTGLVDKSLVVPVIAQEDSPTGYPARRYRLLESLRQYAVETFIDHHEQRIIQGRHLDFFLGLAEAGEDQLNGPEQALWLELLEAEHDNLRAALEYCQVQRTNPEVGLRLATALWPFWQTRGYVREGRLWLAAALARADTEAEGVAPAIRARALQGAGNLALQQADYDSARALLEESLSLYRVLGNEVAVALLLCELGYVACRQVDLVPARALLEESLSYSEQMQDAKSRAGALNLLALVASAQGNHAEAQARLEECLAIEEASGGSQRAIAYLCYDLGHVALEQGDSLAARDRFERSLPLFQDLADNQGIAFSLEGFAGLAILEGDRMRAAHLFGVAEALREVIEAPLPPYDRVSYDRKVALLSGEWDAENLATGFAQAWAEGRALGLDQGIALALG